MAKLKKRAALPTAKPRPPQPVKTASPSPAERSRIVNKAARMLRG